MECSAFGAKPLTGDDKPMAGTATALTSWARAIARALEREGVDSAALFARAGLSHTALDDPNARYPVDATTRLWRLAVTATGDDAFGLMVARNVGPTTFHALGYALGASTTLHEAFDRVLRYFRVVTDAADLEFGEVGDCYRFGIVAAEAVPAAEALDAFAALMVRMCRGLYVREFSPVRVCLRRSVPRNRAAFDRLFRAPLEFDAPENAIYFPRAEFDRRLDGANPELARHNDEVLRRYLARLQQDDLPTRVCSTLAELLPHGDPGPGQIAQRLHLSERSLQRRLAEAQTSYSALLQQTREQLAQSYLCDRGISISEVAFLLGFGDVSSFTRAFRRWCGQSPSQFRAGCA